MLPSEPSATRWHVLPDLDDPPPAEQAGAAHTDDAPSRSTHPSEAQELPFEAWQFQRLARAHCVVLIFFLVSDVFYATDNASTIDAIALLQAVITIAVLACRAAVHFWLNPVAAQRLIVWLVIGTSVSSMVAEIPFVIDFAMSKSEVATTLTYDFMFVPCATIALATLAFTRVQALVLLLPWAILDLACVYQASELWSTALLPSVGSNVELGLLLSLVFAGSAALFAWADALARAQHLQLREAHFHRAAREQELLESRRLNEQLEDARRASLVEVSAQRPREEFDRSLALLIHIPQRQAPVPSHAHLPEQQASVPSHAHLPEQQAHVPSHAHRPEQQAPEPSHTSSSPPPSTTGSTSPKALQ